LKPRVPIFDAERARCSNACSSRRATGRVERLHMLCLAENQRMQRLARKFNAALSFEAGRAIGEMKAPDPTPMSVMRELVVDGTNLATAMLDVTSQLAKRLECMNAPLERRRQDQRYERLMPVDNWR
jgi:hypothetical protein